MDPSLDIDQLVVDLLPGFLRKPRMIAFTRALVYPIIQVYQAWRKLRDENRYKIQHTGQVNPLQQALNQGLGLAQDSIQIRDPEDYGYVYLYAAVEKRPLYLYGSAGESPQHSQQLYLRSSTDRIHVDADFVVSVPMRIVGVNPYKVKYIRRPTEKKPKYLGALYIYSYADCTTADVDLTQVTYSKELSKLKSILTFYKPASKRYKILAYE